MVVCHPGPFQVRRPRSRYAFRVFPQSSSSSSSELPASAKEDFKSLGREAAVYNEWMRYLFFPALAQLDQLGLTDHDAYTVFVLTAEWHAFCAVVHFEFSLPYNLEDAFYQVEVHRFPEAFANYWLRYYKNVEQFSKSKPVKNLPTAQHRRVREWFAAHDMDFDGLRSVFEGASTNAIPPDWGIVFASGQDAKHYWNILLAGLMQHLSGNGGSRPTASYLQIPGAMARFSFWPDFAFMVQTDMSELIRDPVTFGGTWAIDVLKKRVMQRTANLDMDENPTTLFMQNIFQVIFKTLAKISSDESWAVHAVSAFIELSYRDSRASSAPAADLHG
ncbi:hypothetical protein EV122DRAFT_291985 [Schizophyllum commune]